jgi:DNA (cytosine-5)-methyltransferase 1
VKVDYNFMKQRLNFLDLFAGAGGLSAGFIKAGFEPIAHVESDQAACFTLRTRMAYHWLKDRGRTDIYADYLNGILNRYEFYKSIPDKIINSVINIEISRATLSEIFQRIDSFLGDKKLNLIISGPPCQTYSIVGRSRDRNRMQGDKRNYLYRYYTEFLKRYKPAFFIFENVIGFLSARDEDGYLYFDSMRELFFEYDYETEFKILSAEDYGVLQNRKRIILVGKKGRCTGFYPEPVSWNPHVKVNEVFHDLPVIRAGGGVPGPCHIKPYHGIWQLEAGIRNDELPVTWHQSRPNTDQNLEIYQITVNLWNTKRA